MTNLLKEIELLGKLSNAFGPSGNEEDVAQILKTELKGYADKTRIDKLGNILFHHTRKEDIPRLCFRLTWTR